MVFVEVGGDAADAVNGGGAVEGDGDVVARRDAVRCLALCVAKGASVVAVGDGGGVVCMFTAEGGTIAVGHRFTHGECSGGAEAVGDGDGLGFALPSDEAAVAVAVAIDL